MRADLMVDGDQLECTDLIRAATPDTCGHDIDVPDWKFHFTRRSSVGSNVGGVLVGHAAIIFTPGAVISGY
jgi:hypothetical protein